MGSQGLGIGLMLLLWVIVPIAITLIIFFLMYLYENHYKYRKLVIAKCGHYTKIKGVVTTFEGVKIPVNLSEHGCSFCPDKCISCFVKETLGDIDHQ